MGDFANALQAEVDRIGKGKAWIRQRLHGVPRKTLYNWLSGKQEPPKHEQGMVLEILRSERGKIGEHPMVKAAQRTPPAPRPR